jgi:hypothetical protein
MCHWKQKIQKKSFIALFISFVGVYIISSQGKLFSHGNSNLTGVLLATGSSPRDESIDAAKHAAMTIVCLAILNLDEAMTRE